MCSLEISLWLFFVAFQTIQGTDVSCGFGAPNEYASWIDDERGGLKFPIYNQDEINIKMETVQGEACQMEVFDMVENSTESEEKQYCEFSREKYSILCSGGIDFVYFKSLQNETVYTITIENFDGDILRESVNSTVSKVGSLGLSEDILKGVGDVYLSDVHVGIRVTTNLQPNNNYDGFKVEGDAFSNEILKLGWNFNGDVFVAIKDNQTTLTIDVGTIDDGSVWQLQAEVKTQDGGEKLAMNGRMLVQHLQILDFQGELTAEIEDDRWAFTGNIIVLNSPLVAEISGKVKSAENEQITIAKEAFSETKIKHITFKNSNFMKDFDKDAFQGLNQLETVTFTDSKLVEVPRLDLLFRNITQLKAIYITDSITPSMILGDQPLLDNLELLSFERSGPIELKNEFLKWIQLPNLKYLNLQDSNIKLEISPATLLFPIESNLQYLDISYTPLTSDQVSVILHGLKLTHLSLAGLQLKQVPKKALQKVSSTIEYLSLKGNSFEKIPEENMFDVVLNFPEMPELKELDLRQCRINYIEKGAFDKMPKLQKLYLSYNSIDNLQDGWNSVNKPQVKYLDLSYNKATGVVATTTAFDVTTPDNFEVFQDLEILDLSNGIFKDLEGLVSKLGDKLLGLSLCNTGLKNLTHEMFLNFPNLTLLDVSNNDNMEIAKPTSLLMFSQLKSLKYLFLKKCRISNSFLSELEILTGDNVPEIYLLKELEYIDLSLNNIKIFHPSTFRLFPNLKILNLSGNEITQWYPSLKKYNPNLETLLLDDNKIDDLTDAMLTDIYQLRNVKLGNNPFNCNCYVKEILARLKPGDSWYEICNPKQIQTFGRAAGSNGKFYVQRLASNRRSVGNHVRNLKKVIEPDLNATIANDSKKVLEFVQKMRMPTKKCRVRNEGVNVNDVKENCVRVLDWSNENYTCFSKSQSKMIPFNQMGKEDCVTDEEKSEFSFNWLYITGSVLFMGSVVLGILYWKWCDIRLITKALKNAAIMSLIGKNDYERVPFQYNVFISYSDKDRPWVLEKLLPTLESWNDCKVCLHERDFQVGLSILENIMSSIDKSQCIILIISQSFIKSHWCQYEMHLAQHRLLETRRDQLILILLEKIPKYKRTKTLQYLMLTKTYLQWPAKAENEEEIVNFWNRLHKALQTNSPPETVY